MFLLAGLGNPGLRYEKNRHNIGFLALDAIAEHYRFPAFQPRHHGEASKGRVGSHDVLLLKPQTFMNRSGISVSDAARFYKIAPPHVWVFHDELDLAPRKLRIKRGGGDGGHNGLKSIDAHLGKEYGRVRIGIGRPEHKTDVSAYVLGDFSHAELLGTCRLLEHIAREVPLLLEGRESLMMNNVARLAAQEEE